MPAINATAYVNDVAPTTIVPVNATAVTMGAISQFKTNTPVLATYALVPIVNAVSQNSATPVVVWGGVIPTDALGLNVIISIFFNLYNASTQFTVGQTFNYGIYIDGTSISPDPTNALVTYTQTTASNYAMSTGGTLLGTNGILGLKPIIITTTIPLTASNIQIAIASSSVALTTATQIGPSIKFTYYTKNF
jgi:hypothetical protein